MMINNRTIQSAKELFPEKLLLSAIPGIIRNKKRFLEKCESTPAQIAKTALNQSNAYALSDRVKAHEFSNIPFNIQLASLGYGYEQILRIESLSLQIAHTIIEKHGSLSKMEYSHEQIVNIACLTGGDKNISALIAYGKALTKKGFNRQHLVKIAANKGGSNTLKYIYKHSQALFELQFEVEQIVQIGQYTGGSNNLCAVISNHSALKAKGLDNDQITKIASKPGATQILNSAVVHFDTLREMGLNISEIVKLLRKGRGARNVAAFIKHYATLTSFGFTAEQIAQMVSFRRGSCTLTSVELNFKQLIDHGYSIKQIVQSASQRDGAAKLSEMLGKEIYVRAPLSPYKKQARVEGALKGPVLENPQNYVPGFNKQKSVIPAETINSVKDILYFSENVRPI